MPSTPKPRVPCYIIQFMEIIHLYSGFQEVSLSVFIVAVESTRSHSGMAWTNLRKGRRQWHQSFPVQITMDRYTIARYNNFLMANDGKI